MTDVPARQYACPYNPRMHIGDAAIDALAAGIDASDQAASSHWAEMHRNFRYGPAGFSGLVGFGDHAPPKSILHRAGHYALQWPFRRAGSRFATFPEEYRNITAIARRQNRQLNIDMLRQAITLSMLRQMFPAGLPQPIVVIGDGFGTMASLLLMTYPSAKVVLINLTKTLLVDVVFLHKSLPDAGFALVTNASDYAIALAEPKISAIALQAKHANDVLATMPIGLCINIVSMQEMNPSDIASYFRLMRNAPGRPTLFYCCNRLEKTLPDGTRVRFKEYPWDAQDEILVDELCPWNQFYYSIRPPFYHGYDGPIWHRLARLAKDV